METLLSPRSLSLPLYLNLHLTKPTSYSRASAPRNNRLTDAKPGLATRALCHANGGVNALHPKESYVVSHASNSKPLLSDRESRMDLRACVVGRRRSMIQTLLMSGFIFTENNLPTAFASTPVFREYIDTFDGYSFKYPQNWIQVRGAGADIFFRDPFVLDENLSVEFSSPSSSKYQTIKELGSPEEAGKKVLKQYLTEFMSTRLGVRRESNILTTSSRVADDGKLYYQVEVNIKSYANNNELAVMPQDRVVRLEWDRRYLSVLGVENNRLYELRLQTPEKVFQEEEQDLRKVMDSFRVEKV